MIQAALWCLITGAVWTGIGLYFSLINRRGCDPVALNVWGGVFLFAISLFSVRWTPLAQAGWTFDHFGGLLLSMSLAGVSMGVGMVLMILSMKKGPPSVSWSVCQSSMVIPFSLGVLLNGEKSNAFNLIGLLAVVIGIAVFGRRRGSTPGQGASPHGSSWFYMALAGFAVIGLSQYFFSLPSYWPGWIDSYALRIPIQALAGMLFLAALRPSCLLGGGRSLLLFGAIFAGLTFLGRFCLYKSIDSLALVKMVSIAYPVCLGLSILGFVACDAVARRRFDAATAAISLLLAAGIVLLGFK